MRTVVNMLLCLALIAGTALAGENMLFPEKAKSDRPGGETITSISRVMTYQGLLKNNAGDPVPDASYNLVFKLYDAASAGNLLWTSPSIPAQTKDGYFAAELGPVNLPFDITYYLSIQVGADPEMATRQKITSNAYAARTDSSDFAFSIADNSVTTEKIVNGTLQFADIGQNGAANGQVMKWNGTAWTAQNDIEGSGSDNKWAFRITDTADTTLMSGGKWGLARSGNVLWGDADSTHVNLGVACTTGTSGQNYKYSTVGGGYKNSAIGLGAVVGGGWLNIAGHPLATVGGGSGNVADTSYATIAGGYYNTANNIGATVGGGDHNVASGWYTAIPGGRVNTASGLMAAIGGGEFNTASAGTSTIGGGASNTTNGIYAVIGGGNNNSAGNRATVGGGASDSAKAVYSGVASGYSNLSGDSPEDTAAFIGGGYSNHATGKYSTVCGGRENTAQHDWTVIGGGSINTADQGYAAILGGQGNHSGHQYTTIGGGFLNIADGYFSSVLGGQYNHASGQHTFIGGGVTNGADGSFATLAGGSGNFADGDYSVIGGGSQNLIDTIYSTIGGGTHNRISAIRGTIAGGENNRISGNYGCIGGGGDDTVKAVHGGVASGYSNLAGDALEDTGAFVGGGYDNAATGRFAAIGAGNSNRVDHTAGFVGGGLSNFAGGDYAVVAGGTGNTATGYASVISGGLQNTTYGHYSAIVGGLEDTLTTAADYSMVFGRNVYLANQYRVAFFDSVYNGRLGINRDDQSGGINYPIHVGANASNGNGAYLSAGGVWTNGSSRTFKENFTQFDSNELLSKISNLSVTTYNYTNSTEKHVGPVAEEFVGAFDTGVIRESDGKRDDMYLSSGDVAGVALAGVQEIIKQNKEMKAENENMKSVILDLERRLAEVEKHLR